MRPGKPRIPQKQKSKNTEDTAKEKTGGTRKAGRKKSQDIPKPTHPGTGNPQDEISQASTNDQNHEIQNPRNLKTKESPKHCHIQKQRNENPWRPGLALDQHRPISPRRQKWQTQESQKRHTLEMHGTARSGILSNAPQTGGMPRSGYTLVLSYYTSSRALRHGKLAARAPRRPPLAPHM